MLVTIKCHYSQIPGKAQHSLAIGGGIPRHGGMSAASATIAVNCAVVHRSEIPRKQQESAATVIEQFSNASKERGDRRWLPD